MLLLSMNKPLPNSYSQLTANEALAPILPGLHAVDTIIPLTYTTVMDQASVSRLSSLSRMAIDAAISLAEIHRSAQIVIASEHTFGPEQPATSQLMCEVAIDEGIKPNRIELVDDARAPLDNTPQQLRALRRHMELKSLGSNVIAVAMDYHIPRIFRHARAMNIHLNAVAISDVLAATTHAANYPEFEYLLRGSHGFRTWESIVHATSKINPNGQLLDLITKLRGPQVHDLVTDEKGQVAPLNVTTKKYLEQLRK